MIKFTGLLKTSVAMLATVAASGAMALDGIAMLNTGVLTANSMTASSLGFATYTASTGKLVLPIDEAGSTVSVVDFGLNDGFKASGSTFGLSYSVSFTDMQFSLSGLLTGKLTGGGIVSSMSYTGDMLQAGTLTPQSDGSLIATNFSVTPSFSAYLINAGASSGLVSTIGTLVTSVTVPEPGTYALMGLGLVGIAFASKRRSQA